MSTLVIDAFEFCRLKERRDGVMAVAELPRLAQESVGGAGTLHWNVQGGVGMLGHPQLNLAVRGEVRLVCQRCLNPFSFDIDSSSVLVLAPNEESADEIDMQLEDEDVEVVVGSSSFDLCQVIEDEALLAIPLAPRHEACVAELPAGGADSKGEKVSPFAVLKDLKK